MHKHLRWMLAAGAVCAALASAAPEDGIGVAAFSSAQPGGAPPAEWTPLTISGVRSPNAFSLVVDGGATVLRVESKASASGLKRKLRAEPADYPMLRWRWKISNVLKGSDISRRDADDYPARLYVMFDYPVERLPFGDRVRLGIARALHGSDVPAATLSYVWDGRAPAGTIVASPYTDRVRIVVVESGSARVGRWVDVERDVAADFRAAFGEEPPAIAAVAVAVDTDNTGESVTTHFGDISLHKRAVKR